jgi:thymidylate synthase
VNLISTSASASAKVAPAPFIPESSMHLIRATNVNDALAQGLHYILRDGVKEGTRNGPVLVAPGPVITTYRDPQNRVLFSPLRDANPFFHLLGESLWMLSGRNDIEYPSRFVKSYVNFSDDGETAHGAYGFRWLEWFGFDQLAVIVEELKANPLSRRAVLSMWDPMSDLVQNPAYAGGPNGRDVPCNTQAYFDVRGGRLNMTVCCRSNDIYWGAYGANAVHFSILQEYMAARIGCGVGEYRQFSNNYHLYTELYGPGVDFKKIEREAAEGTLLYSKGLKTHPLVSTPIELWHEDLSDFMCIHPEDDHKFHDPFFNDVAMPMFVAWDCWKKKNIYGAQHAIQHYCKAPDWAKACYEWLERRRVKLEGSK